MTASTAFLALPSLSPKTLALYTPKPASIYLYSAASSALALGCKPISISASFLNSGKGFQSVSSRFVRDVAVSSEFEQDEEVLSDDGEAFPVRRFSAHCYLRERWKCPDSRDDRKKHGIWVCHYVKRSRS